MVLRARGHHHHRSGFVGRATLVDDRPLEHEEAFAARVRVAPEGFLRGVGADVEDDDAAPGLGFGLGRDPHPDSLTDDLPTGQSVQPRLTLARVGVEEAEHVEGREGRTGRRVGFGHNASWQSWQLHAT